MRIPVVGLFHEPAQHLDAAAVTRQGHRGRNGKSDCTAALAATRVGKNDDMRIFRVDRISRGRRASNSGNDDSATIQVVLGGVRLVSVNAGQSAVAKFNSVLRMR